MKKYLFPPVGILLIAALLACDRSTPAVPVPTPVPTPTPVVVVPPTVTTSPFNVFPGNYDFFAQFPTLFPESNQYRVSVIQVSAAGSDMVAVKVFFLYDTQGRLRSKNYMDWRGRSRSWQHDFTFDAQQRLIQEVSADIKNADEYTPVQIDYTYTNGLLTTINRKTAEPVYSGYRPNLLTKFQYAATRRVSATIINYSLTVDAGVVNNVQYPADSIRRTYAYADNDRQISVTDSIWSISCYPNIPCPAAFTKATRFQTQLNERGDLATASQTPANRSFALNPLYSFLNYEAGPVQYQNEYNGPDGLLGTVTDVSRGIVYRFLYEKKP